MAVCRLFFLVAAYSTLGNRNVWEYFFSTAPKEHYRIYIHQKFKEGDPVAEKKILEDGQPAFFQPTNFTMIPVEQVFNAYYKLSYVTNQLLKEAVEESSHHKDRFLYISADSIPVKSFDWMYSNFCGDNM